MALALAERDTIRNLVERWLALNADSEDATLTIRIGGPSGPTIETTEKRRLPAIPEVVGPP